MNIDSVNNLSSISASHSENLQKFRPTPEGNLEEHEKIELDNTQALVRKLVEMSEVRPEMVERGRKLAADPNYPSDEIVNEIAKHIARMPLDVT